MKTRITVAMIMFIGFVLCSAVVAYMPALIIRECPHCKAHVVQEETVSGNTIGATYWTDGKREAKMLPDHPWLAKCPACSVGCSGSMKPWRWTPASTRPKESSRSWLLQKKRCWVFCPGRPCPGIRNSTCGYAAWRSANDAWRWNPNATPAFSKDQVQNLKALSEMLDETEPNQRILKAEIARELGEFR